MNTFKKTISTLLLIAVCSALFTACTSGKTAHCAAYGSIQKIDNTAN